MSERFRWLPRGTIVAIALIGSCLAMSPAGAQTLKLSDELLARAIAGDAAAQYDLGLIHEAGEGVTRNYQTAKAWYTKAAEQDHPQALFELGMLYATGRVTDDLEEAVARSSEWFDRLDEKRFRIDREYYISRKVKRERRPRSGSIDDQADRVDWLHKTAPSGHAHARRYLGYLYDSWELGPRNCIQARFWYGMAAARGDAIAQSRAGDLYAIPCEQKPADEPRAVEFWRKAALQGDLDAQISLSASYKLGRGIARSPEKSTYWIAQAADSGNRVAQNALGDRYREGFGVPRDLAIAESWYMLAADAGYDRAISNLAELRRASRGNTTTELVQAAGLLAILWAALDGTSDDAPQGGPSNHSPSVDKAVREALEECRHEVWRRMVHCTSYIDLQACQLTGCHDYEWVCIKRRGRGKCTINETLDNYDGEFFCDSKVGKRYDSEEELLQASCY